MKKSKITIATILSILIVSCTETKNKETSPIASVENNQENQIEEGKELLEKNCYSCHNPNATHENRMAPPMIAVKRHYIDEETKFEDFSKALNEYATNPTEEKSLMPGAVNRFGVMPKMNFKTEDLAKIAYYIFYGDIAKPEWFEKHFQEQHGDNEKKASDNITTPLEFGKKIAMQTKSQLGKNLINAINSKGTENALEFCNTRAIKITDSMANVLNAKIKRVSDKNRNKNNVASEKELVYLKESKEFLSKGEAIKPKLIDTENGYIAYYPIMTNKMCLQCHGKPNVDIKNGTLDKIQKLYPNDLAQGYGIDELRGIWVIQWDHE